MHKRSPTDLVSFTEEILDRKLHFLRSVTEDILISLKNKHIKVCRLKRG